MVVSAHRLASKAGVDVLKGGGNAVDAAIAVGYALAVTFPEAGNLGGGGFMTVRFHDGRTAFIDFRETAPGAATATMYQDANGNPVPERSRRGYLAVGVPGTVSGLELARTRFGTRSRATLMADAIRLARDGFVLDQGDADMLADAADEFRKDGPSAAIFLNKGQPWKPGQRLVQTDLARSLSLIAKGGTTAFYKGPIGAKIVAASKAGGGILSTRDFAAYQAREMKPLECDYRGYHMISAPPPSSGGVVLCETFNILEGYPIGELGFHSAAGTHLLTEALRRAYHDRNLNLGDPSFVTIDTAHFIDKGYAAQLRQGIDPDRATPSASLGGVGGSGEGQNTTHFSIVDKDGNAVSLTYTLNDWFGAHVTAAGTGILLNDEMDDFSAKPGSPNMYGLIEGPNNAVAPGKRPLVVDDPDDRHQGRQAGDGRRHAGRKPDPVGGDRDDQQRHRLRHDGDRSGRRPAHPSPVAARRDRLRAVRAQRRHGREAGGDGPQGGADRLWQPCRRDPGRGAGDRRQAARRPEALRGDRSAPQPRGRRRILSAWRS